MPLNHKKERANLEKWKSDAIADGWIAKPLYTMEGIDSACHLEKEGYIAFVFLRTKIYDYSISMWGPDGLAVNPPATYSWEAISRAMRTCMYCHQTDVDTTRVGFAGRCCMACLPKKRAQIETPGWYN